LLVVDGHCSRNAPGLWRKFGEAGVDVLCFPAHVTHLIQPLDLYVNSEFKRILQENIKEFTSANTELNIFSLLSAVDDAIYCGERPKLIRKSFSASGVIPFRPSYILEKLPEHCPESFRRRSKSSSRFSLGNKVLTDSSVVHELYQRAFKR
jgi:hypothetical protein